MATRPIPAMQLRRPSDAPAVTGRVARWHLTLMEIPSAGADPVTSVRKNSFAGGAAGLGAFAICAFAGFWLWIVLGRLGAPFSPIFSCLFLLKPRPPRGFFFSL